MRSTKAAIQFGGRKNNLVRRAIGLVSSRGIVAGVAKVSVRFPDSAVPFELTTTELEVPVVSLSTKSVEK
jgi:hypothetical protein